MLRGTAVRYCLAVQGTGAGLLLAGRPAAGCLQWVFRASRWRPQDVFYSIQCCCCCREPVDFGAGARGDSQRQRQIEAVSVDVLPFSVCCWMRRSP